MQCSSPLNFPFQHPAKAFKEDGIISLCPSNPHLHVLHPRLLHEHFESQHCLLLVEALVTPSCLVPTIIFVFLLGGNKLLLPLPPRLPGPDVFHCESDARGGYGVPAPQDGEREHFGIYFVRERGDGGAGRLEAELRWKWEEVFGDTRDPPSCDILVVV